MLLSRIPVAPGRRSPAGWAVALGLCLSACAQPPGATPSTERVADTEAEEGAVRVICKLSEPRAPDAQLALDLARAAGMPVLRVSAIQDTRVAVTFHCHPSTRCEEGLARLRSASKLVSSVTPDGRAQTPRQPVRPQERP
jgi:hypothetical protein